MAELAAAVERLARAVNRLETVAQRRNSQQQADRTRLAAELAQAREEYAALADVTDRVSLRLDGAIDRLKTVLEV
jgi:hypothetical protein